MGLRDVAAGDAALTLREWGEPGGTPLILWQDDVEEANERLVPRFAEAVPQAEISRPGCRHAVFADLGVRSGDLVVERLQRQGIT